MLSLRVASPAHLTAAVLDILDADAVAQVGVVRAASVHPPGDVVEAEVAREGADAVVEALCALGIREQGSLSLTELAAAPYDAAAAAVKAAPGASDDSVLWRAIEETAESDSHGSMAYLTFLVLATALASIAVITDSPVLVVGAMVVGPEFSSIAALCIGLARRRFAIAGRAVLLLLLAFTAAIAVIAVLAWVGVQAGWITQEMVTRERPLTGFIWHPDRWSFVVALLAGAAGVLSVTSGQRNALVGVFISVTTVPAAGNLALALATRASGELTGSALQLLVNVLGMTLAGVITLLLQQLVWSRVERLRPSHSRVHAARTD